MVFSSLLFLFLFLPVTLLLYYLVPNVLKNIVLITTSLLFYAWGEPIYILIMLFAIVFDYINGILIEKYQSKKTIALMVLILSISVNLGLLCFFKYYGFLISNVNKLLDLHIIAKSLPLPLGISFYTFQSISYVVDVYKKRVPAQRKLFNYAVFVTMFPQLVAGPIIKYIHIYNQFEKRKLNLAQFSEGVEIFIMGLAKKVLLANNIGSLWTSIKVAPINEISVVTSWIGILAFTFQIYFDFSGYSQMALGLGKMLGFDLVQNFNYPYISKSVTEFWKRWHMSLGSWFREYVYIPLGGNRCGKLKQYRNLLIVWFLTGFWHGANWNFIIWGMYFCLFVILEKVFLLKWLEKKPAFISHVYTLLVVIIGWVLFEFEDLANGFGFIKTMFGFGANKFIDSNAIYYIYTNIILFILLVICSTPLVKNIGLKLNEKSTLNEKATLPLAIARTSLYMILLMLCTAYLVNLSYNPFLYFRF